MDLVTTGFGLSGTLLALALRASVQLSAHLQFHHPVVWSRIGRPLAQRIEIPRLSTPVGGLLTYVLYAHYREVADDEVQRYGDTARCLTGAGVALGTVSLIGKIVATHM